MENNCVIERNALRYIIQFVKEHSVKRVFLVGDINTYPLAGDKIRDILSEIAVESSFYILPKGIKEPNEIAVGSIMLHIDPSCDLIIGIGSGVINDLCKLTAGLLNRLFIIVATAPSMDGYASPLSSMVRDGLKVSIPTKRAELIVADIDILKTAPLPMLKAGLGDMLAKYVSICEWRIGSLITGEPYDAEIAESVRRSLDKCVRNANGLLLRSDESVGAVFEGLVMSGEAMKKAGVSRPASGAEHYFSHLWDMRGLEFGTPVELHGLQCAAATRICVNLYNKLKEVRPDRVRAIRHAQNFDVKQWNEALRNFLGRAAEPLIELEKREGKYCKEKHAERLSAIIDRYDDILAIIEDELPSLEILDNLYRELDMPTVSYSGDVIKMTVKAGKDIRNKYVLPHLLWDLGILDDLCEKIEG